MKYIIFHLILLHFLADISALMTDSKPLRLTMENDAQSSGVQRGKTAIQPVGNDGFRCQDISFNSNFSSGSPVRVFISINHGEKSSQVHDPAFIWVADVTASRFKACLVKSGRGSGQNTTIDWFAFEGSQSGVYHGLAMFRLFTTEILCRRVTFPKAFSVVPKVHVTVQHNAPNQKQDAMIVWTESVSKSQFEVCLLESRRFDGPHNNTAVNWIAYEHFSSLLKAKESSEIMFADSEVPTAESNYALCKNITFVNPFFTVPVALITARNGGSNKANAVCRKKCPVSSWLEEVTTSYFRVCIRDNAGYNGQRSNVIVDYLVIGDLDPCTNVTCKYHSHCVSSSPHQFTCVCEDSCPSYEEQVCASNGRTFQNLCLLQQEICRTRGNYTKYHPGSCTGFPLQKGRHEFQNTPSWAEDQCNIIKFERYIFYPNKKIYIQLTVNHHNYTNATFVHEATTPWVESVNSSQFTACVTRAGRNDYPSDSFATIDWIAYQGAPSGGVVGEKMFSRWWTGTSCQLVTLPKGKYSSSPKIFATAEHHRSLLKHDATSVWLEDVSASSFKICLRELQNYAGAHDDISVNWLAFESLQRPLFSEHNDVNFRNDALLSEKHNFAFCQDVNFKRSYSKPPTVVLTAKHSTSGRNAAAECTGIVSWIEFITKSEFRICAKELFVQRFDPLTVSYAVLTDVCQDGWTYFKGYCYRKVSSCDSWSSSEGKCAALGANLPSVHSQEENVYIQSLHGGEQSWLGLSDVNTEGTFVWSDGTPLDFRYWAKHQPNNSHNEDCVHTLGFLRGHKYKWNDVNCTDCHRFTCKRDYNECKDFSYDCPVNATCVNSGGSYTCRCPVGYRLDGKNCTDVDECLGSFSCLSRAHCVNVPGSYKCKCPPGYRGDGKTTCKNIDECASNPCKNRGTCTDLVDGYSCNCATGFTGKQCEKDINECLGSYSRCDVNAICSNTHGSYVCSCKAGFTGDGKTCNSIWPSGTYGLPRSTSGCPQSNGFQWKTGWRYQDTEDTNPRSHKSSSFHLDGSVSDTGVKRGFCIKEDYTFNNNRGTWPKGQYCIYKKGVCPNGLHNGWVYWDDEDDNNNNGAGGKLPDGVYSGNTKIFFCCRTDGSKSDPISLPVSKPFYLLAYGSSECQRVKDASSTKEFIAFDSEDKNNNDARGGYFPYIPGTAGQTTFVKITYCYYKMQSH